MNEYEQLKQGKMPKTMSFRSVAILSKREKKCRLKAEKLAMLLRASGILVAVIDMSHREVKDFFDVEELQNLDCLVIPAIPFWKNRLDKMKICYCCYDSDYHYHDKYEEMFDALLEAIADQEEVTEIKKIRNIIDQCQLAPYLELENMKLIKEGGNFDSFEWQQYLKEEVIPLFEVAIDMVKEYDVFTSKYLGFFKMYLQYRCKKFLNILDLKCKYFEEKNIDKIIDFVLKNQELIEIYPSLCLLYAQIIGREWPVRMFLKESNSLNSYIKEAIFKEQFSEKFWAYEEREKAVRFIISNLELLDNLENFIPAEIKYLAEVNEAFGVQLYSCKRWDDNYKTYQEYKKIYIRLVEKFCEYYIRDEANLMRKGAIMNFLKSSPKEWGPILKQVKGNSNGLRDCNYFAQLGCYDQVIEVVNECFNKKKALLSEEELEELENVSCTADSAGVIFSKTYKQREFYEVKELLEILKLVVLPLKLSTCEVEEFCDREKLGLHTFVITSIQNYNFWEEISNENYTTSQKWFPSRYADIELTLDLLIASQRNLYAMINEMQKKVEYFKEVFNSNMKKIQEKLQILAEAQARIWQQNEIILEELIQLKFQKRYRSIFFNVAVNSYGNGPDELRTVKLPGDTIHNDFVYQAIKRYSAFEAQREANELRKHSIQLSEIPKDDLELLVEDCKGEFKSAMNIVEEVTSKKAIVFYSHDTVLEDHSNIFFQLK